MKASDVLIYILGVAGALAGYLVLQPPLSWAAVGLSAAFAVWTLLATNSAAKPVLKLAGLSWSMEDIKKVTDLIEENLLALLHADVLAHDDESIGARAF
jgi:hypothetical protein